MASNFLFEAIILFYPRSGDYTGRWFPIFFLMRICLGHLICLFSSEALDSDNLVSLRTCNMTGDF